jgi:steroid delta-isomerase-like uncharacterized protein
MSSAENVALMRRWFEEVWNQGRMDTVRELLDENGTGFGQGGHGTKIQGPADFIPFVQRFLGAFPDMEITVQDAFGDDHNVAVRWSATMTHTGGDLGIPPTNREASVTGITIARFANGKIVAGWDNWDQLALLRQLGVVPEEPNAQPTWMERKQSA